MQGKFCYGGEGAKVPGTDFGISFGIFKLWLCPTGGEFRGYTTASNAGLLGAALVESPVVDFMMTDLESEEPFMNLHNAAVDAALSTSLFAIDGGTATLTLALRSNDGSPARELTFFSDQCRGAAAAMGDIHFTATLLELPSTEWDATRISVIPW